MSFQKKILAQKQASFSNYILSKYFNAAKSDKKQIISITANLIVYGQCANKKLATIMAKNIESQWNRPKAKVNIAGFNYLVRFKVKPFVLSELNASIVHANRDQKNIFIRVAEKLTTNISIMDGMNSNTGLFQIDNIGFATSTTEAHEYGHALGLWPDGVDGHPTDLDQRGKGKPGIMYPRGTWVDAPYQYDPKAAAGAYGGTMNPSAQASAPTRC
jgi:hypothetical protein